MLMNTVAVVGHHHFSFLSNSAEHSYGSSMVSSKDGDKSKR